MHPGFVIGAAFTGAVATFVAAVVGNVAGILQLSATMGVLLRTVLVIAALAATALFWWRFRGADDTPSHLAAGLVGAWLLNPANWTAGAFVGRLVSERLFLAIPIDLLCWVGVSFGLATLVARRSAPERSATERSGWKP